MMDQIMATPVASFIFAITILSSIWAFSNETLYGNMVLYPYGVSRGQRVYTLLTSGLIHGDWMHLFFNMFSFYFFAFALEPAIGHWQFGLLYVVSMVLSDLPSVYKHRDDDRYHSLGASGAISAVVFSAILYNPFGTMLILPIPFPIYSIVFGVLYLVYCNYASKYGRDNVNHDAHMFGAISGLLITIIVHPHIVNTFILQITEKVQSFGH